jgi:hypothetical protein
MLVVPGEVLYDPWFTYIWTLAQGRFPEEFRARIAGKEAFLGIAQALLRSKGQTELGELSRLTGISRSQCGLANHYLVEEGFAWRSDTGIYRLADLDG